MEIWLPRNDSSPPSHRRHLPSRCVLSRAVPPSPNHFAAASPAGCLRLGASVLPRVPKWGAGAKRDLGRAAGASGCYRWYAGLVGSGPGAPAAWLVPDAEQGSRLVRTTLGEPGAALLSTWVLRVPPGAHPNGCLSPTSMRHPVLPREGGKDEGGGGSQAGTSPVKVLHPGALRSKRTLSQHCVHLTCGPCPEQALVWGEGRREA